MQYRNSTDITVESLLARPLKNLTPAEFKAFGDTVLVYIRTATGAELARFITDAEFNPDEIYQLVASADGSPLLVTDGPTAITEWLSDKYFVIASLH
ncbi:MAG TPA: DUF1150 family protein [Arsenicitalea sp.]|jgi:hypothetical protein|nr:DUF1150 family protein [Arsenicitalea sp.]